MRKVLLASALGLASLGAFTQLAFAEPQEGRNCSKEATDCSGALKSTGKDMLTVSKVCSSRAESCRLENWNNGYNYSGLKITKWDRPPDPDAQQKIWNYQYYHATGPRPKTVNGKAQRTADGRTIYVTSEGHEFASDGETIQVKVPMAGGPGTITVMVGDPDAPQTIVVNGQRCRAAEPKCARAYMDQEAADAKKRADAEAAQKKQKQANLDSARDKGGILQQGGTPVIKEDVDVPQRRPSGQAGATSTATGASTVSHPTQPAPAASKPVTPPAQIVKVTPPPAQSGNPKRQAQ